MTAAGVVSGIAHVFGVADELIPRTALDGMKMVDFMVGTAGIAPEWTEKMARAATSDFRGAGPVARMKVAATAPVLGMMAYFSSAGLVRQLLRGTPLRAVSLRPWMALTGALATAEVRVHALIDRLPGRARRLARRARGDDPVWRWQARMAKVSATRAGLSGTPYDHHDGSASGQVSSCPAR